MMCMYMLYYFLFFILLFIQTYTVSINIRGHRGHDHMVVGFTTTYAISAYHHWCCEFESRSGRGVQHHVIKFVSDLRQGGGFLCLPISSTKKTDGHDITETLLKVALNTIKQTNNTINRYIHCGYLYKHLPHI
jgi:uncharacterized membrane protein YcgQ (UPF0703/DUF1980 family)